MHRRPIRSRPALVIGGVLTVAVALAGTMSATAASTVASAVAPGDLQSFTSHGEVLNILPPGSNGNVSLPTLVSLGVTKAPTLVSTPGDPKGDLTTATGTAPAHFADQLEMYDALSKVSPGQLTANNLTAYYKDARLGVADADVVSTEMPRAGLTIKRDRFGVPAHRSCGSPRTHRSRRPPRSPGSPSVTAPRARRCSTSSMR